MQKAHEKSLISLDNIKSTSNKFVTCDENDIKIWQFIKKEQLKLDLDTLESEYLKNINDDIDMKEENI